MKFRVPIEFEASDEQGGRAVSQALKQFLEREFDDATVVETELTRREIYWQKVSS